MNMNPDTDTNVCSHCTCYHNTPRKSLAKGPYECLFCGKQFTSKDSLRYHKHKYHRDTTNVEKIEQMLEQCLRIVRILTKAKRQAVQQEEAEEEHSKRPKHDPESYESYHVSSTTTFG